MSLSKALRKRLAQFHARLQRLHDDASPKNVHEFRVACRELLACYPLLKLLSSTKGAKPMLKKALRSLNDLRDLQQMQQHLLETGSLTSPQLVHTFEKPLCKANARWQKFARELQAREFIAAITAMEKTLSSASANSAVLQTAWEQQWERSLRRVRKQLLAADPKDLDDLHHLRIRCKELRYLLELRSQARAADRAMRKTLKEWQEKLGDVGDLRVMAQYAHELGLPKSLQQQYRRQAAQQAKRFMKKRTACAAFITELDQQLER